MRIAMIAKQGHENTGVGRYTAQLRAALEALGHEVVVVNPTIPLPGALVRFIKRLFGWDLNEFFNNYPVWARYPQADIYHITSQNLATLMLLRRPPGKTVITVHDIIPWLFRGGLTILTYSHWFDYFFDWLAMNGIGKADHLIIDSSNTFKDMVENDIQQKESTIVALGIF